MSETDESPKRANRPLLDMTLVIGSILLLAFALSWWLKRGTNGEPIGGLEPGRSAPQIVAKEWLNGPAPAADALKGRVVVLNAWFTTCPYCVQEAPELIKTYEEYRDRGVVFLGLTYEEEDRLREIEQFIEKTDIPWPNGYGGYQTLVEFETVAFPALWVIGRDGVVVWNRDSAGELADGIELALSQK